MNSRLKLFFVGIIGVLGAAVPLQAQGSANCVLNLQGQQFHISGGTGGLTKTPSQIATHAATAGLIESMLPMGFDPDGEDVAIIVVDNFVGDAPQAGTANNNVSHGTMVVNHLDMLINSMSASGNLDVRQVTSAPPVPGLASPTIFYNPIAYNISEAVALNPQPLPPKLYVVRVDSNGINDDYNIDSIMANVSETMAQYVAMGVTRFVVNMSFTILPCDTVYSYISQRSDNPNFTLQDYFASIVTNFATFEEWLEDQVAQVATNGNAFGDFGVPGVTNLVFVAAAGNVGEVVGANGVVSFYPGAWDEVINVSATEGDGQVTWAISSVGEVSMPGAWYALPHSVDYYAGTSFAAPAVSLTAALFLTQPIVEFPFDVVPPLVAATKCLNLPTVPTFDNVVGGITC